MQKTAVLKVLPVSELKPAEYNPRKKLKAGDKEYEKIKNSIEEFGFADPLVVNNDMTIIGGHQRLTVAIDLGYTEVPCAVVDVDKVREKALNIALNKITGAWDEDLLAELLEDIQNSSFDLGKTGFDPPEINTLFNKIHDKQIHEDDFDVDDEGEDFCRLYCDEINEELSRLPYVGEVGIKIDKILLYKTDKKDKFNSDKDNYKNRGTAKIQAEMTDEEQRLVADLCAHNRLDDEHYLIKDGSLEYNPSFSNVNRSDKTMLRENYRYVVGVSKRFDPELLPDYEGHRLSKTIANLKPFERTKAYRYTSEANGVQYAVWYLRLRNSDFRETNFSDVVKCEMVIINEDEQIDTDLINTISANLIKEAYPVCYGNDTRWANHLYPVYLTETFCKSKYYNSDIILNLF